MKHKALSFQNRRNGVEKGGIWQMKRPKFGTLNSIPLCLESQEQKGFRQP